MTAQSIIKKRLAASKEAETLLRDQGHYDLANQLTSLRLGYIASIETCRRLYRDNEHMRRAVTPKIEATT